MALAGLPSGGMAVVLGMFGLIGIALGLTISIFTVIPGSPGENRYGHTLWTPMRRLFPGITAIDTYRTTCN